LLVRCANEANEHNTHNPIKYNFILFIMNKISLITVTQW